MDHKAFNETHFKSFINKEKERRGMHRLVCKQRGERVEQECLFFKGHLVYVPGTYLATPRIGYKVMLHTDYVRHKTTGVTRQLGLNADGHGTPDVTEKTSCH